MQPLSLRAKRSPLHRNRVPGRPETLRRLTALDDAVRPIGGGPGSETDRESVWRGHRGTDPPRGGSRRSSRDMSGWHDLLRSASPRDSPRFTRPLGFGSALRWVGWGAAFCASLSSRFSEFSSLSRIGATISEGVSSQATHYKTCSSNWRFCTSVVPFG